MRINKVLNILDQQQINPADVAFGLLAERTQQGKVFQLGITTPFPARKIELNTCF